VEFILHVSILWKAVSPRNLDFRCFQTSRELRRLWQLQWSGAWKKYFLY